MQPDMTWCLSLLVHFVNTQPHGSSCLSIWNRIAQTLVKGRRPIPYKYFTIIYETNNETKLVLKNELTEINPVETHEGGLKQDDPENKSRNRGSIGAGAKILDWSDQEESSFAELDVAETEELAEKDPGELGDAGWVWKRKKIKEA